MTNKNSFNNGLINLIQILIWINSSILNNFNNFYTSITWESLSLPAMSHYNISTKFSQNKKFTIKLTKFLILVLISHADIENKVLNC